VLEVMFILLEPRSPSRRIFIGSHSLPPLWFAISVLQRVSSHHVVNHSSLQLRRHVRVDHQDLAVWDLQYLSRIVRGDGRTSDLKHEGVRRRLTIDLVAMSCSERSVKLLDHTALARHVFGFLVDRARVVEVAPAVSTIWCLGSRFDLDLALHVVRRYVSCVPWTKRHAG
jgi:hypothetical protein